MKLEYSKLAYKRWNVKGLVEKTEDGPVLHKNGKDFKISFNGKKVNLELLKTENQDDVSIIKE